MKEYIVTNTSKVTTSQLEKNNKQEQGEVTNQEKDGFMAIKHNVWEARQQLWHEVSTFELQLVDAIISKTIKWRTDRAQITLQDFMEETRKKPRWIYAGLNKLEKKGIIIRVKHHFGWVIGLNPDYFGGLLIKRHQESVDRRKTRIRLAVDNSKLRSSSVRNACDKRTHIERSARAPDTVTVQKNVPSDVDIIEENASLKKGIKEMYINKSLKERDFFDFNSQSKSEIRETKPHPRGLKPLAWGEVRRTTDNRPPKLQIKWLLETGGETTYEEWSEKLTHEERERILSVLM